MDKLTYTVEEAGKVLGLSRPSAYAAAASGELPTIRIGRRLLVPRVQLEALLAGRAPGEDPAEPVATDHD